MVAVCREALDILLGARQQDQTHGEDSGARETASSEDSVNECPSDASVAVGERVDGLELGVDQGGLEQWSVHGTRQVVGQILDQSRNLLGRRRYEIGADRMRVTATDPVLSIPQSLLRVRSKKV